VIEQRSGEGRVVVTGARGFIGANLIESLRSDGVEVVPTTRRGNASGALRVMNPDDPASLSVAMRGARSVVHLGGLTQEYGPMAPRTYAEFRAANVDATAALARAAAEAGVSSFVFMSSISAVSAESSAPVSESTPANPRTLYGRSKLEAEKVVEDVGAATGMRVVSLRPTMVYGPGMKGNALRLFDLAWGGIPIPVGAVKNSRSVIFVGNLVGAIRAALESDSLRGAFFVADEPPLSTAELVHRIARALGRPDRVVPVPVSLLRLGGKVGDVIGRVLTCPLTSREVHRLVSSLAVDSSRFNSATGYKQRYDTDESLRLTAEWYRALKR
jgi:nucleoside-diphosphate-sugar epimerase